MLKLIDNNNVTDPCINLSLEEFCVRNLDMKDDYLLFYINEPSIIIGKHQNTIEEINMKYVKDNNINVVRRISGGGTVYHDKGNLNFSFMTRHSQKSIHNFKLFTDPVIRVLNQLGVKAILNGRNDITVEGRKISGNAQFTDTRSMFSHGTLLFDSDIEGRYDQFEVVNHLVDSQKSVERKVPVADDDHAKARVTQLVEARKSVRKGLKQIGIRSIDTVHGRVFDCARLRLGHP